ncbi:MAG: hypothetical protein IPH46_05785 [Bacteroidetes bacterium]|nr:hypothetical protein [Bacteroidota bacterium]
MKVKFIDQELEALKRLFGDEIPPSFYKDLNVAALVTGLIYLKDKGFNVTEAELNLKESHKKAQLYPIYNKEKRNHSQSWAGLQNLVYYILLQEPGIG